MRIIPSFKPAITFRQLNATFLKILCYKASDQKVGIFEGRFSKYLGIKYAICVPSGRWGLYYILESLNLEKGDEVIVPAFTYFAVPAAVIKLGLRPVFVDIDPENFNLHVQKIEESITEKTKVVIVTHLCGFVYKLDKIINIARRHNLKVIEDCAQALGAEYKNKKVGSWGDAAYFTFGITKNFTTLGGGMVVTDSDALARALRKKINNILCINRKILFFRLFKGYLMKIATVSPFFSVIYYIMRFFSFFNIDILDFIFREKEAPLKELPMNGQMNDIQAELGVMQLDAVDRKNEVTMNMGIELYRGLKGMPDIRIPLLEKEAKNIFSGCPILVKDKRRIRNQLLRMGIDTSGGYMQDCSKLGLFEEFKRDCVNASRAERQILYLPVYSELSLADLGYIKEVMRCVEVRGSWRAVKH